MDKEKRSRKYELDSFWDISELVPARKASFGRPQSTDAVEVTLTSLKNAERKEASSTIIKRYIPSRDSSDITLRSQLDEVGAYAPVNSLIHNVKIYKYKPSFAYYETFYKNAVQYIDIRGEHTEFVPFFSYVPQYDQMNSKQLEYYFWFRQNARDGKFIKTDFGYLFLYIFELLNLGSISDVRKTQYLLMALWNEYHADFPAITTKLSDWICDFSLLHRLPPPMNISSGIIKKTISLKEFYISISQDDPHECAKTLLQYCTSYDYRKSKFYTDLNRELFDRFVPEALSIAVKYFSGNGNIFSGYDVSDSLIARDVYAGAVCTSEQKYRIEVSYCSFSRSNELRFLIGDIVKYSENKLRAHIGIKSKMTVYSLSVELRRLLDEYFVAALPTKRSKQNIKRQEYDVLYDIPKKPLSLSDAAKIEEGSWETTRALINAFEGNENNVSLTPIAYESVGICNDINKSKDEIPDRFSAYRDTILRLINNDPSAINKLASSLGKLPDAVVDTINEIAFEEFGDQLIEDDGMGGYSVIEDYIEYFK